jgi:hypothetical protein
VEWGDGWVVLDLGLRWSVGIGVGRRWFWRWLSSVVILSVFLLVVLCLMTCCLIHCARLSASNFWEDVLLSAILVIDVI